MESHPTGTAFFWIFASLWSIKVVLCNMASFNYCTALKLWSHLRSLSECLMLDAFVWCKDSEDHCMICSCMCNRSIVRCYHLVIIDVQPEVLLKGGMVHSIVYSTDIYSTPSQPTFKKSSLRASWAECEMHLTYYFRWKGSNLKKVVFLHICMALQKPYKCMPLSGVFSKVLTQKFLYLLIGNSLRVGITNPCGRAVLTTGLEFASDNVCWKPPDCLPWLQL